MIADITWSSVVIPQEMQLPSQTYVKACSERVPYFTSVVQYMQLYLSGMLCARVEAT